MNYTSGIAKMKLGRSYVVPGGNMFRVVHIIYEDGSVWRVDIRVREGRNGSVETRASVIKELAREKLAEGKGIQLN